MAARRAWRGGGAYISALAMVGTLLAVASPASAVTSLDVVPSFPVAVTVGETFAASLTITNVSSGVEATGAVTVTNIVLVPACGTFGSGDCPGFNADPGAFQVTQASGGTGACAGMAFAVTTIDPAQGKLQLTPAAPLVLGQPGGATPSCRIDLVVPPSGDRVAISSPGRPVSRRPSWRRRRGRAARTARPPGAQALPRPP